MASSMRLATAGRASVDAASRLPDHEEKIPWTTFFAMHGTRLNTSLTRSEGKRRFLTEAVLSFAGASGWCEKSSDTRGRVSLRIV